ncbi:hypothetical protein MUGA111182_14555 [Mucilaginibacter galii]|uniref:Uncharacterized protein n=1 Tax=Mucilaginibacter galii TaxID=2005073 RepID=A0A917JAD4_9SPHI|nr:hypothetical protein [Mucilaginibacter galii]GGI50054.1 hypothetical protein GCM10011425_12660 [Mucilaginibacter galii]
MDKLLISSYILCRLCVFEVNAQPLRKDSVVKTAYNDVKRFKLYKEEFKKFKKNKTNSNSDLFKPTKATVSDTASLADSVYVNAFRNAAYNKTLKRRTTGHYFLVGGAVYVAVVAVASVVVLFVLLAKATK